MNLLKLKQFRDVVNLYKFLYHDSLHILKYKVYLPVIIGLVGVFLHVVAISGIFLYAKSLYANELPSKFVFIFNLLNIDSSFTPRESILLLFVVSIVCLVTKLVASFFSYYYLKTSITLACEYEKSCIVRTIEKIKLNQAVRIPVFEGREGIYTINSLLIGDSRQIARSLYTLLITIVPFITFLGGCAIMFYVNWQVTLLLAPTAIVHILLMYKVNRFGVNASRNFEIFKTKVSTPITEMIKLLGQNKQPIEKTTKIKDEDLDNYLRSYGEIIELSFRSSYYNDLFNSTELTLVLFSLSLFAMLTDTSWEIVPVYLVALKYMVSSLNTFSTKFNVANRFFPQANRFYKYFQSLNNSNKDEILKLSKEHSHYFKKNDQIRLNVLTEKPSKFVVSYLMDIVSSNKKEVKLFYYKKYVDEYVLNSLIKLSSNDEKLKNILTNLDISFENFQFFLNKETLQEKDSLLINQIYIDYEGYSTLVIPDQVKNFDINLNKNKNLLFLHQNVSENFDSQYPIFILEKNDLLWSGSLQELKKSKYWDQYQSNNKKNPSSEEVFEVFDDDF